MTNDFHHSSFLIHHCTVCGRGDLNPHASRRYHLKVVRLPISPLPRQYQTLFEFEAATQLGPCRPSSEGIRFNGHSPGSPQPSVPALSWSKGCAVRNVSIDPAVQKHSEPRRLKACGYHDRD